MWRGIKTLSEQAMKALFSVYSLFDSVSHNVSEKIKLFDAMVCLFCVMGARSGGFMLHLMSNEYTSNF